MSNVPKLRFKEFSGEWEEKKLKDIVKINQGLQIPISDRLTEQVENSFFYITNEFLKEKSSKKYFILNPSQSVICTKDDILMTRTGNTGMVVTDAEGAFHNNFFKVAYHNNILKGFLYNFLKLRRTQNQIMKMAGTSTIPDLNHSDFYSISMAFPSSEEQQRIALFLSAIDVKIDQLTRKKELFEQYKKGVMQKVFSQELRFKADDGSEFSEWEEKIIADCIVESKIKGDTGDKAKKLTVKLWNKGVFAKNEVMNGSENTQYYIREAGQFIYSKLDFLNCAFGVIPEHLDGYQSTIDLPCFEFINCTNPLFFLLRVSRKNFYLQFGEQADGSRKARRINQNIFLEMPILLPSVDEQTKIANFLSAIDTKIDFVTKQLDEAKNFKKGLLQQMFV